MKLITNEMLECDPQFYEALEANPLGVKIALTPDNLRTEKRYERQRIEALVGRIERDRGIRPIGNLLHFASALTDVDINYASYCNE